MSVPHRGDFISKAIGVLVFVIGVGLLLLVFKLAYGLFTASPATALGLHITGDPKRDPGAALIGQAFGYLLVKILLLFVMSLAALFTAQKGINLYFSCLHGGKQTDGKHPKPEAQIELPKS